MVSEFQSKKSFNSSLQARVFRPLKQAWRVGPAACLGLGLVLAGCTAAEDTHDAAQDAAQDGASDPHAAAPEADAETMPHNDSAAPTLSRSVVVNATADEVWAAIGSFCSVQDWHPVVGSCTLDGNSPPTRTLVTVDGTATFVEQETMRDDVAHSYSYAILSGPLPVSDYVGTISVAEASPETSTITWSSVYTAAEGQDDAASGALTGIYDSGLTAIAASMAD
jgi:hypothetical protein